MNINVLHTSPYHVVAVSALIWNLAGDLLLLKGPLRGWEMPGGQVEHGETLIEGLQREIWEETGTSAEIGSLIGIYSNLTRNLVIFSFRGEYQAGELTTSPESLEIEWLPPQSALLQVTHPAIIDRLRDGLRFKGKVIYRAYSIDPYQVVMQRFL